MAFDPKPVSLTQVAALPAGSRDPEPLLVVGALPAGSTPLATTAVAGAVKKAATVAAPVDAAADHAAVLAILVSLKAAGIMA